MKDRIKSIDLISMTQTQRKQCLEEEIIKISDLPNIDDSLQNGKKFEILLNQGFPVTSLIKSKSFNDNDINDVFINFKDNFLEEISNKLLNPKESVYTLTETPLLSKANTFSRSFSTKLGDVWEDIAFLSPKIISVEKIFDNFKIKGVDIIIDEEFRFCQLKTMKGTLTGSQKPRSEIELKIYDKSSFIAALDMGSWTFNSPVVSRISGREFWDLIEIDYDLIITNTKTMLISMEDFLSKE